MYKSCEEGAVNKLLLFIFFLFSFFFLSSELETFFSVTPHISKAFKRNRFYFKDLYQIDPFIKLFYFTNKSVSQWFFSNLQSQTFANSQQLVHAVSVDDSIDPFHFYWREAKLKNKVLNTLLVVGLALVCYFISKCLF